MNAKRIATRGYFQSSAKAIATTGYFGGVSAPDLFVYGLVPDHVEVKAGALIHMTPELTHGIVAKTPLRMLLTLVKAARNEK